MPKKPNTVFDTDVWWWVVNPEIGRFSRYLLELDRILSKEIQTNVSDAEEIDTTSFAISETSGKWSQEYTTWTILTNSVQELEDFANILFKSFIVSVYSYLESSLLERCRGVEQKHNYRLSVKDLSGQGIQQAMSYLLKVHQLGYSLGTSKEWGQIQNLRILRNCIAHNGGRLDLGTDQIQKVRNYVSAEPLLNIDNNTDEIVVSREYCEKALLIVTEFLYAIDKALGKTNSDS